MEMCFLPSPLNLFSTYVVCWKDISLGRVSFKDTINPLQLFIFTNVIRYSRRQLWVGYLIFLKFTGVSSIVYQSLHFSSIKETNKGTRVLSFDVFKHLLLRKTDFLKTCRKSKFLKCWKENLKNCTSFEEKKGTRYVWGKVYFDIIIVSCLSSTKPCLRFLLNCFFGR